MDYNLPASFKNIKILSSQVSDGSMDRGSIKHNLPVFLEKNSINSPVAYSEQVHSKDIKIIKNSGFYQGCDGLVTGEKVAIFVKSADCIPLLFYFSREGIVGALHVSRKSLLAGMIGDSLNETIKKLALSPASGLFFLGPHIRAENYEIGDDILAKLPTSFSPFVKKIKGKNYFDLTAAAIWQLALIGAKEENIVDSRIDNYRDRRFFSYRRGDRNKLFITIIYGQ